MTRSVSSATSPNFSASGTNTSGPMTPRSGWVHRASASYPTTDPSAQLTLGWYTTDISSLITAARNAAWNSDGGQSAASSASASLVYAWLVARSKCRLELRLGVGLAEHPSDRQAVRVGEPTRGVDHSATHPARDDHRGGAVVSGEVGQHVQAVHLGHDEVHDDERGLPLAVEAEELLGVVGELRLAARRGHLGNQETSHVGIIVDDQDALRGLIRLRSDSPIARPAPGRSGSSLSVGARCRAWQEARRPGRGGPGGR